MLSFIAKPLQPGALRPGLTAIPMRTLLLSRSERGTHVVERALQRRDHLVQVCTEVEAAWAAYQQEAPPLIVLGGVDEESLALCRRIRASAEGESATVVAVLDEPAHDALQRVIDAGADDYVLVTLAEERLDARLAFVEQKAYVRARRTRAETELRTRAVQQAVVATLGQQALAGETAASLMDYAVQATAEALQVEYCKVLEWCRASRDFLLVAGWGWREGAVGHARVGAGEDSQAGYTLLATQPVVVEDLRAEERFAGTALLHEHGIVSGISVVIAGDLEAYGVLSAHTRTHRRFSEQDVNFLQAVANVLAAALDRKRADEALRESEAKARAILETTVDAIITIDDQGRIESFNSAAEQIFQYKAPEVIGRNVKVLMPAPYRQEHDDYIRSYRETGRRKIIGIGREVVGRRKDGTVFPMDLAVSEVKLAGRRLFTGIIRDITERRRLEQEILEISDKERRRIGQDLHDGLGQMLTGTALISQNLARKLKANGMPGAADVAEITDLIKEADQFARALAKGLVPVELEANGLAAALLHLTKNAERLFSITCTFEEVGTTLIHDAAAAMHLYRIAQEAVSNAVKHGQATHVTVRLASGEDQVRLHIQDDGVGFPDKLKKERGMGVRIMQYRARIIGGTLEIWRDPAGGTVVLCTVPRVVAEAAPAHAG